MLGNFRQKHPCLTSGPGGTVCPDYGNGYSDEPCASCPLPGLYVDELNKDLFPTMAFLRDSSQFGKEKKKMAELKAYFKTCDQCKEKKKADSHFGESGSTADGYLNVCSKCIRANKEDKELSKASMVLRDVKIEDLPGPKSKKDLEEKPDRTGADLKKYCAQEGISVKKVISSSRLPEVLAAKKRIAKAMDADGIDRKLIATELKVANSTLWNYLREDEEGPENSLSVIELDFTGREDLLEKIRNIAEDRLREPAGQILWWLINTDFDKLLNGGLTGD